MTLTSICLNRPQANEYKKERAVINDVEIVTAPLADQNQIKADAYLDASRRAHGSYMAAKARYCLDWTILIAFSGSLCYVLPLHIRDSGEGQSRGGPASVLTPLSIARVAAGTGLMCSAWGRETRSQLGIVRVELWRAVLRALA